MVDVALKSPIAAAKALTEKLNKTSTKIVTDRIIRWKLTGLDLIKLNSNKERLLLQKLTLTETRIIKTKLTSWRASYGKTCKTAFNSYQRADLRPTATTVSIPKSTRVVPFALLKREQTRLSLPSQKAACMRMCGEELGKKIYGKSIKPKQHHPIRHPVRTAVVRANKIKLRKSIISQSSVPVISTSKISTRGKFALLLKKPWIKAMFKGKIWEIRKTGTGKVGQKIFLACKDFIYGETTIRCSRATTKAELKANISKHHVQNVDSIKYTKPHIWEVHDTKKYIKPLPCPRKTGQVIWCKVKYQNDKFVEWSDKKTKNKIVKQKSVGKVVIL